MNWDFSPLAIVEFVGVTPSDTRTAAVTDRVVDPETPPKEAVTVVEPVLKAAAKPFDPAALLTEATLPAEEVQVAVPVRSWVE